MVDYSPGMRVIIRDEEWMIKKVETNTLGNKSLHCVGVSKLVKDYESIFLTDLEEIEKVDPRKVQLVIDDSPFFRRSRLFIESQWRQKIPTDSALHIGNKAAMDLINFQLEPAQMSLQRPRQRILIADTVGLGKTLEAGILMSELIARGKGKRILVVTVKSMMTQFQKEMWNRFTIPLIRMDSSKIQKVRAELPANYNPFFYYDKTIVSIDTIKRDIEYRTHLENAWWDIIVIDEAHNVAERGKKQAQRAKLAKLLSERSDTLIMLSATPHDGRSESFASLMNMLDPTAIANPKDYNQDDIKGLFVRRFKKDVKDQVKGAFKERQVTIESCNASDYEEAAFEVFADMQLEMDLIKNNYSGQLFKTSLEKALFSSPAACIKSIDERLKRLRKKYGEQGIKDIKSLEKLKGALEEVIPEKFSKYQNLLTLLKSPDYNWNHKNAGDRVVIFTERIETMRYLVARLRQDLKLKDVAVQELYGGMSDQEQQSIVEEFGREESPIRILVASDVASEGINLHYLSHRLIHFDIPWSLMVFQQRNGRIDRYGQSEKPDIRYMLTKSHVEEIKGDLRIIEILIKKEEQAYKNIGDPALLFGKFDIEEEELIVTNAIEDKIEAEKFEDSIDSTASLFDPLELLMQSAAENNVKTEINNDETLYSDIDYISSAMNHFSNKEKNVVKRLETVEGLEVTLTKDLRRRLKALIPPEALPQEEYLRLSPDKDFCMNEMKRSLQNNMSETAWPATQYLWKIHPIFNWLNDKAGLLFARNEAPLIGINEQLQKKELIYIVAGTIPNRKSTPVVDEWFGLHFNDESYIEELTMEQVINKTGFGKKELPNRNIVSPDLQKLAEKNLLKAVDQAYKVFNHCYKVYEDKINPLVYEELEKLEGLKQKHMSYQMSLFENERRKNEEERRIESLFDTYVDWVSDTLEIEDSPYLRVMAVLVGV